jgi:phosphoenolpyruvate carboxylase
MPEWIWVALVGAVQVIMGWLVVTLRAADQAQIVELKLKVTEKEKDITTINATLLPMVNQVRQLKDDQARVDQLEQWIQAKENAITGINEKLLPMVNQVKQLEEDRTGIRAWKHLVVDPYIPRAVEEHERRINRLEGKVFNGGGSK